MTFTLNNREERMDAKRISVDELLRIKKFTFKMRIVKINGKLINKKEYDTTYIEEGDDVQMLYLMSGG